MDQNFEATNVKAILHHDMQHDDGQRQRQLKRPYEAPGESFMGLYIKQRSGNETPEVTMLQKGRQNIPL